MQTSTTPANRIRQRTRWVTACAAAFALTFAGSWPRPAHAADVTPPAVPDIIKVPVGHTAFLEGHAMGTQGYICLPCPNATTTTCPAAFAWTFVKPQATLFDDSGEQIVTHFLSSNAHENPVTARATWQHSQDTSRVWAKATANSSDPNFVASGAIPWLLLQVVGSQTGPTNGTTLTATTYIQRLNTMGGILPSTPCAQSTDVGAKALVPYSADYFFYKAE